MIIFINGPINTGKSTVAKLLTKRIPNSALLEIDELREMINWMPIEKAVPINLENAVLIIKNFCRNNLSVIVPYPLSQKNYEFIIGELKEMKTKIYFFTLAPRMDIALKNKGERQLQDSEKERIKFHYEIGIQKPTFGEIIDNSGQTPRETAEKILSTVI